MSLKTFEHSTNYTAAVIKLPSKEVVPGLDNLVKVTVFGNDCLIGKDSSENTLYLFFPAGTQLAPTYLKINNLYRDELLNSNEGCKGFFEPNGRVKAIRFKGVTSTGFVIPIGSIPNGSYALREGDSFNEIDGFEVCRKYVIPSSTPGTPGSKADRTTKVNNRLIELMIPNQFRFHEETTHLANNISKINPDDIIVITDKWHGSSCILSKVHINKRLKWHKRFLNKLGANIADREYGYIYSSGKPKSNLPKGIVGEWENSNKDFYGDNIWKYTFDFYKEAIEDGISIYGELVGFTASGSPIQKGYDYGCTPMALKGTVKYADREEKLIGHWKFVVYRITYTKSDGNKIEFSWQQIQDYCKKYDLEIAKELYFGKAKHYLSEGEKTLINLFEEDWKNWFFNKLQEKVEERGNCNYCINKVPSEGMVVRVDGKTSYNAFKVKSKAFLKKESDDLDKGETNIEDNA